MPGQRSRPGRLRAEWLLVAIVLLCTWDNALSQNNATELGGPQDLAFSLHMQVPVQCTQIRRSLLLAASQSMETSLWRGLRRQLPFAFVNYAGCRQTVSGQYTTYSITGRASSAAAAEKAKATLMQFKLPSGSSNFCTTFSAACATYKSAYSAAVSNVLVEGVAPARRLSSTIPLGWTGYDGSKKMMLPVTMGSQNQSFAVVLDTGSSVPYVMGYNWQESKTFSNTTLPGTLEFGGAASVTGFYATDTATIGSITDSNFKFLVPGGDEGVGGSGGGLFGFAVGGYAFPGQPVPDVVSSWQQLSTTAGLNGTRNNRYGLWLSNNQELLQENTDFGGEMDVGVLNVNRYSGSPVWLPVVPANSSVRTLAVNGQLTWWQFVVARMAIEYADGSSQTICENCNTIADSGWPNIVITPRDAGELAIASMTGTSPALGCAYKLLVDVGAAGQLRMNLIRDGKPPVANCATNYAASGDAKVFINYRVSGLADGVDNWYVLGLPFLRQFYTVFDYTALKIGFYKSVQNY